MRTSARWAAFRWTAFAALGLSALAAPVGAQGYFGQNQVQYDRLNWRVIETEHFLVHYYPQIAVPAADVAKMAERSYARLSILMGHQFREKKPLLLFGSSGDFAQSNVFGDLGEGTGGVTDPVRQRMAEFLTGDYGSFEHVMQHEMVHEFQFDIFSRGRAGVGLGNFEQVNAPLWFMEGMAEYFSIGQHHPFTDAWIRDGVVNNTLPSIQQMTDRPDKYFPYRYGLSLWQYIGARWGDEVIAEIMNSVPSLGIDRSFRRELGLSMADLSTEWHQAMQAKFLPVVAQLDRPRSFADPLLSEHRSGGNLANLFVAPSLSPDGKTIAFVAYGSLFKGEVFPDLYIADAETGKREARLVKSTNNPDFEQLRFIYSQSAFSPDGQTLAFTSQRGGHDILNLLNVKSRKVFKRIDYNFDQLLSPSWSPDGATIVFAAMKGGLEDLYTVGTDGKSLKQLTSDKYGDTQPQWSPDGKTIAFTSDRGPDTDFEILKIGKWKISLYDVATGNVTVVPGQAGLNINPQWAPDGQSIAFVSDRTGTANLFLYDLTDKQHYQLTNVAGGIYAVAEYSPAITWARGADVLAFVYYEKGDNTVWRINNPRALKKEPFREPTRTVVAQGTAASSSGSPATSAPANGNPVAGQPIVGTLPHLPSANVRDSVAGTTSVYRAPLTGSRLSGELPLSLLPKTSETVSITAMMDSFNFAIPDSTRFKDYRYKVRFQPEYISQPSIGVQAGGYSSGAYGGTTVVLGDLLGDHRIALSGALNGKLADATVYAAFTNLSKRLQYQVGLLEEPYYFLANYGVTPTSGSQAIESYQYARLVERRLFGTAFYPLNRFTRFELGVNLDNIDEQVFNISRVIDYDFNEATGFQQGPTQNLASATNVAPFVAWVNDNSLSGYTGPIAGQRIRLQVSPSLGTWQYTDYLVDARKYVPIIFNYLWFAGRFATSIASGRDEGRFPKWVGSPLNIRGFSRDGVQNISCSGLPTNDSGSACSTTETIGSRVAFANAELRFPILRTRTLPIPPLEGLFFYDAGVAWSRGQKVSFNTPANYDPTTERALLRSFGAGLRLNLFNIAIVRYDYAFPTSRAGAKGFGTFSIGASY